MARHTTLIAIGVAAILASTALALVDAVDINIEIDIEPEVELFERYGPYGGGNPYSGSGGGYNGDGDGDGDGSGFAGVFGSSLQRAIHYRTIHGILASVAMVVLFPVGSSLMRLVPGRFAIWAHALLQLTAYALYIAGAALGIYLVKTVRIPFAGGNLLTNPRTSYHPILGLVVLATLFFQPLLGYVHHKRFKQLGRRTIWSHLHLWNGRIGITAGIINGGLGLHLARASRRGKTAYIVVAVILWSLWMLAAIISEARRARRAPAAASTVGVGGGPGYNSARRSHASDPEMSAARAVSTPGTGSTRSSPPRSGNHSPKARQSRSTVRRNSSTRR